MSHHIHPDPAVRALIAQAERRGAERVAQAVEGLAHAYAQHAELSVLGTTYRNVARDLRALLAECRGEGMA